MNAYLQEISGQPFTAKDFRTWAGTVLAAMALREFETFDSEAAAKKNIVAAIEHVAERLGNTPSVCRKCYVHPAILESYIDGSMLDALRVKAEKELTGGHLAALKPEEAAVVGLLRERLSVETDAAGRSSRPSGLAFTARRTSASGADRPAQRCRARSR